jgi:hypothetical protein
MRVFVSRLIFTSEVSGTCFTRTMMFMNNVSPKIG